MSDGPELVRTRHAGALGCLGEQHQLPGIAADEHYVRRQWRPCQRRVHRCLERRAPSRDVRHVLHLHVRQSDHRLDEAHEFGLFRWTVRRCVMGAHRATLVIVRQREEDLPGGGAAPVPASCRFWSRHAGHARGWSIDKRDGHGCGLELEQLDQVNSGACSPPRSHSADGGTRRVGPGHFENVGLDLIIQLSRDATDAVGGCMTAQDELHSCGCNPALAGLLFDSPAESISILRTSTSASLSA